MSTVSVRVDDRLRLAGCLLAAGDWPEWEQARKPYKPHRVAEGARRSLLAHRQHPAVGAAHVLAATGEDGLSALFAQALAGAWPAQLAEQAADFTATARPEAYWASTDADWRTAEADLRALLAAAGLREFLAGLFGGLAGELVVYPNLLYPGRQAVVSLAAGELVLGQPPPPAWGSSAPWRYGERPDEVLGELAEGFARGLLQLRPAGELAGLSPAGQAALPLAAAVLFLRQAEGPAAADQYMMVAQRMRGLPRLAAMVKGLAGRQGWAEIAVAVRGLAW